MYVETKTVHSSAFPALFYLTLVLSTILIRSTTWIRWRPGICGLQARVLVHLPPRSQDCEKLGGGLGTRLCTHFDKCHSRVWLARLVPFVSNNSNSPTQAWWGQSVTSCDRSWGWSVTLWSWSANSHHGVWQAGAPSDGQYNNPLTFHPYSQL